ncbi:MAG: barstar family protein [Lachnospiraceae bacterium]|nr:barstar family protein [Lachnospiraceae bacterium]
MNVVLDARRMETKESAHAYLQEKLSFPEYYGKNLDALYECLCEISDMEVVILHRCEARDYYWKVETVFRKAGEDNKDLRVQYAGYKKRRGRRRGKR